MFPFSPLLFFLRKISNKNIFYSKEKKQEAIYYLFLTNLSDFNEKLSPSQRHRGSGSIGKLIDVAYSFNVRNIRRSQISLTRAKISSCASHRGEISFSSAAVLSADKLTRGYAGASTRPPRRAPRRRVDQLIFS